MRKYAVLLVLLSVLAFAPSATAQERGQTGFTFAFPASVGLIFHPTDDIAVRPDFTFSTTTNDTTNPSGSVSTTSGSSVGFGVSALFYVRAWEHLRPYVTPRFGYTRTTSNSGGSSTTSTSGSTGNGYSVSGSIGAQYALSRRFGVFAEAGIAYSWNTSTGTFTQTTGPSGTITSTSTAEGHNWNTRAGIGAILYF